MMRAAVVLLVVLFSLVPASGKRSNECPGGCIIASVVSPQRVCTCVVPSCVVPGLGQQKRAARMAKRMGSTAVGKNVDRPAVLDVDCDFCDRDAFTYSSFKDCEAADDGFKPRGPSIDKEKYPHLEHRKQKQDKSKQRRGDGTIESLDELAATAAVGCPPAALPGCPDLSTYTPWESLYANATSSSDITISGTVVLNGCAQPSNTVDVRTIIVPAGAALIVSNSPLKLNMQRLAVFGTFQMGTPSCPITESITVTIPGGNETYGVDVYKEGSYDVHGAVQGLTWTRIAATVPAGSKVITLQEAVQWKAGDMIVLVTTTWKDELMNQNEVLTVESVSADGLTINTVEVTQFNHYGVEYKAEVGLLSRNILFTSDATSTATGLGPHTTMFGPNGRITGAAFERWGARNKPGKYSIHYHLAGSTTNAYIKNNAIYNSNWRCITVHGTHDVYLYGNVGFNVHGHCFYLEDGVEERNVFERNLAAYVHPINTAGSSGGQQGTDRWQSPTFFDPSDSSASGFYALNLYNTWLNNAASGGFAGFTFPRAPRAIKDHKNIKKANGYPFDPSERPFILFKGNSAHSTGYFWEHSAAFYFGGTLFYKTDPSDGQVKLFYNNGRGPYQADPLCPDPDWPASDIDNNNKDCMVISARRTRNAADTDNAFLYLEGLTASLANVGVGSWGERVEVNYMSGYDVTRGTMYLGQSWMTNSYFRINTTNTQLGWSRWPFSNPSVFWESFPVKGFEFYDTLTSTLLSNVTFDNYKYNPYTSDTTNWWYNQTAHAFRMLSHSDQYKPDKTMMVTKGISCTNCDFGTCTGSSCTGGAFFRVDKTYRSASWLFNWLDQDGSVVRHVAPSKPTGPYLITAEPDWWNLGAASWLEPKFGGVWVSPMPANEVVGRLELRVQNAAGFRYTMPAFDGEDIVRIGYVSQFGDAKKFVVMTKTEGTTGMTGKSGWYTVFNTTTTGFHAPKRLEVVAFNVPRRKYILWASCWPAGTTFSIAKTFDWANCQNVASLPPVSSVGALLAGGGNDYFVDANNCLHLKITDPGHPWQYTKSFERDGMYIEEEIRWYDLKYIITTSGASMSCSDPHFCPLPGDPATRVPPVPSVEPPGCLDVPPPGDNCGSIKCAWSYGLSCTAASIVSGNYCQASCGRCPAYATPSPSPVPRPASNMTVFVTMAVTSQNQKNYQCQATVTVRDAATNAFLPSGQTVTGQWSKVPDTSSTDGWPNSQSQTTSASGGVTFYPATLPKSAAMTCVFTVTSVTGTAASTYVLDTGKSVMSAKGCWSSTGAILTSCP